MQNDTEELGVGGGVRACLGMLEANVGSRHDLNIFKLTPESSLLIQCAP